MPDRGGNDHYALRGRLAWQPGDATDVDLIVRYLEADGETQAGLYSHEPACPNAQFQGDFTPPDQSLRRSGARVRASPAPASATTRSSRAAAATRTRRRRPSPRTWTARSSARSCASTPTSASARFTSITDYQTSDKFYTEGGDSSPDDGVYFFQGSDLDQISQEFRYAWSVGDHQMVAGLFGMDVDGDYIGKFASRFYGYDPDVSFTQETTSFAVFFQDEWSFAERWKLIGGLRYWDDSREGAYFGNAPAIPDLGQPRSRSSSGRNEIFPLGEHRHDRATRTQSFDDFTARLQLDYRPNDDVLWYLSYNRGSKSGGFTFSTGTPFDPNQVAFLEGLVFEPETLNAYELGMKSSLAGGTVDAEHRRPSTTTTRTTRPSRSSARSRPSSTRTPRRWASRSSSTRIRPTGCMLQLGASFMDSKVKDITLPDLATVVDHDLPQAPPFAANALARYEFPLGAGTASVQGDVYYTDDFCFTTLCAPVEQEASYTVANARVGYAAPNGRWEVAAFVNNLFEEEYRVYAFDSSLFAGVVAGVYAKPRTYGVTASLRFGARYE